MRVQLTERLARYSPLMTLSMMEEASIVTPRRDGKMANDPSRLLRELWKRANNERDIAAYYEEYTGYKMVRILDAFRGGTRITKR